MDNIAKLAQLLAVPPKSIDLIPGDGLEWLEGIPDNAHAPFLFVEGNLGVPEKALYKTYMASVEAIGNPSLYRQKALRTTSRNSDESLKALELTSVILLANPAHQSALNLRKTVILNMSSYSMEEEDGLRRACFAELEFIASLLSVKQCSKVSMLWHHRRGLLACIFSSEARSFDANLNRPDRMPFTDDYFISGVELPASTLQAEYDLTTRACEVYPRNYFAWFHRWLCFQSCLNSYTRLCSQCSSKSSRLEPNDAPPAIMNIEDLISSEIANTKVWIERHISDYSAVDYICRIVEALEPNAYPHPRLHSDTLPSSDDDVLSELSPNHASELLQHALSLVQSYPLHESLWLYLRRTLQMIASFKQMSAALATKHIERRAGELARTICDHAARKCQSRPISKESRSDDVIIHDAHTIERHALRFLLWQSRLETERDDYDFLSSSCSHFRDACMGVLSSPPASGDNKAVNLLRTISLIE
ncbi:hypothetical protein ACEPAF_5531 [Sanghuangporus sanghuang]